MPEPSAQLVIQLWHLILAGAGAFVVLTTGYMRIRTMMREAKEREQVRIATAIEENERQRQFDAKLKALSSEVEALHEWRNKHIDKCTTEHSEIRNQITESSQHTMEAVQEAAAKGQEGRDMLGRQIAETNTTLAEISGTLKVLLAERK